MSKILADLKAVDWLQVLYTGIRIVIILLVLWAVIRLTRWLIRRFERRLTERGREDELRNAEAAKRVQTLSRLLNQAALVVILVVGLMVVLDQIGVAIGPILASAGIAGLAIGFGAQTLVKDVTSGFFVILENQVRVGDVAIVNGTGGLVERINLRTIVLRDLAGVVHIFQNGSINSLANMTSEWSAYVMDIGVAYKEDVDRVIEVIKSVAAGLRADPGFQPHFLDDIEVMGLDQFADSAVVIKARIKTKPIKQWEVGREYNRRLKAAFDREGIEIPFPHRSIYVGEASKPMRLEMIEKTGD